MSRSSRDWIDRPEVKAGAIEPAVAVASADRMDDVATVAQYGSGVHTGIVGVRVADLCLENDITVRVVGADRALAANRTNAVDPASGGVVRGRVPDTRRARNGFDRQLARVRRVGNDEVEPAAAHQDRRAVTFPHGVPLRFHLGDKGDESQGACKQRDCQHSGERLHGTRGHGFFRAVD